mmetsp:Transcript_6873/g.19913  ORF Transcript_6873/g.19913 Transcript_6873/m.19913 type:complete len:262 (-) Transcript_6873:126-911(-)
MEEYDELVPDPNSVGIVDMSARGWKNPDPSVWGMGINVIKLDLSYNKIEGLSDKIANLRLLNELNLENNALADLPPAIGELRCLRVLNLNFNKLTALPEEIGQCTMIEQLLCTNNVLVKFPESVINCIALTVLNLRCNRLTSVPLELGGVDTLKSLDLSGNEGLHDQIPDYLLDDSAMCMFILQKRFEFREELSRLQQSNLILERKAREAEEVNLRIKDEYEEEMERYKDAFDKFPHDFRNCQRGCRRVCPFCTVCLCNIS